MNKVNSTIFGLAFIVLLCGAASATQINVNQTGWWNAGDTTFHAINSGQIQAAIDNASTGDTIYVYNGTYSENVDVNKQLTLVGEDADVVTVTAANPNDHVFYVTANYVNITGFKVTGGSFGIDVYSTVVHCNISDNIVSSNSKYGILLEYANNYTVIIRNNIVKSNAKNSGYGIYLQCQQDTHSTITDNDISDNNHGIHMVWSTNNNISCNWVQNNAIAGFYLEGGSTDNTIENNDIIANGEVQGDGSYHWQFENCQSSDVNTASNWWGTNNETRINASIYDQTHYASYGEVITSPRLDGPAPCAPVPELPTIALLAAGLLMLAGYVRIERKKDE